MLLECVGAVQIEVYVNWLWFIYLAIFMTASHFAYIVRLKKYKFKVKTEICFINLL